MRLSPSLYCMSFPRLRCWATQRRLPRSVSTVNPPTKETAGAIAGDGLISSVSGLFGCLPLTSFAQNIGLVAMTKVVNRKVILSGGLIFGACQLRSGRCRGLQLPAAGCAWRLHHHDVRQYHPVRIPADFEAGYTQRNITIAALSLTIGIGFTQVGDIFANFPALFPVHLRFQLHRGVVRGGCDSQRRSA